VIVIALFQSLLGISSFTTAVSSRVSAYDFSFTHVVALEHKFLSSSEYLVGGKGKGNVHPRTGHEGPEGEQR
jgi:hypothetical protein